MIGEPQDLLLFGLGCGVAVCHLFVGILGFQYQDRSEANRIFLLLEIVAAWTVFWVGALGTGYHLDFPRFRFLTAIGSGYIGPLMFLFCLGITRPLRGVPKWAYGALVTGMVGTMASLWTIANPSDMAIFVLEYERTGSLDYLPVLIKVFTFHSLQNLSWNLAALAVLLMAYRNPEREEIRRRALWVLLAVLVGIVSIVTIGILPLFFDAKWVFSFSPVLTLPMVFIVYHTLLSGRELVERLHLESAAMKEAKRLAEEANRAKSAFLANMSHELRTPLNAVIGYSQILAEDLEVDAPFALQDLARIETSGRYLLALIDDILDLSKVQAGRIELQMLVLSLAELFKEVELETEPLFTKWSSKLEVHSNTLTVVGDPIRTKQILLNLLSNAAKFSAGNPVTLRAGLVGGRLHIEVVDRGVGMSEAQLSRLFIAFEQVHQADLQPSYGGTGLGLVLSRELALQMDGNILVRSEPDLGSTFTLVLSPPSSL